MVVKHYIDFVPNLEVKEGQTQEEAIKSLFEDKIKEIRETASAICKRRERYADVVADCLESASEFQSKVYAILQTLSGSLSVLDSQNQDMIRSLIATIKSDYSSYLIELQKLKVKFQNSKIKIVAAGNASAGKSTFTQLYTKLPDAVVHCKSDSDPADATGAVNVIHHKDGVSAENPEIIVSFKSPREIVDRVNSFMKEVDTPCNGKHQFNNIDDLRSYSGKRVALDFLDSLIGKDYAVVNGLRHYLGENIDLQYAGHEPMAIQVSDLPKYNYMQYSGTDGKAFSTVDHIDIYVDLGMNKLFEKFLIADTKGSSTGAGGEIANEDIYREIENSDAVFSLVRFQQNGDITFVRDVLYKQYRNNTEIRDKHFSIANIFTASITNKSVEKYITDLKTLDLVNTLYVGALKERPVKYEYEDVQSSRKVDPQLFVYSLIVDMLGKITSTTKSHDDALVSKCNALVRRIDESIKTLNSSLQSIVIEDINLENILQGKIQGFVSEARKRIQGMYTGCDLQEASIVDEVKPVERGDSPIIIIGDSNSNSSHAEQYASDSYASQYTELRTNAIREKDNSFETVYSIICGLETKMSPMAEKDMVRAEIHAAVVDYMKALKECIPPKVPIKDRKSNILIKGDRNDIGTYIDSICQLFRNRMHGININKVQEQQINVTSEKLDMFTTVWNTLKLNAILGSFDASLLEGENLFLSNMREVYHASHTGPEPEKFIVFSSFDILQRYFTSPEIRDKNLNEAVLIESLADCIPQEEICKLAVAKHNDKTNAIRQIKKGLISCLEMSEDNLSFEELICPLYKLNIPALKDPSNGIISVEDNLAIEAKDMWDTFSKNRDTIALLGAIPTIQIS